MYATREETRGHPRTSIGTRLVYYLCGPVPVYGTPVLARQGTRADTGATRSVGGAESVHQASFAFMVNAPCNLVPDGSKTTKFTKFMTLIYSPLSQMTGQKSHFLPFFY